MQTLAHKPKATPQTVYANSTEPDRTYIGQRHPVGSALHIPRTIGHQAFRRSLPTNLEEGDAPFAEVTAPSPAAHDFDRIPIYAPSSYALPTLPATGNGHHLDTLPLPSIVRAAMEDSFGEALGDVRLRVGPRAGHAARMLGAHAYTAGSDIVLGDQVSTAEFSDPQSPLLAHELTHVLQHRRAGNPGMPGTIAPSRDAPEREARRNSLLNAHGLPLGPVHAATDAVALTPTSDSVAYDLSLVCSDQALNRALSSHAKQRWQDAWAATSTPEE